MDGVQPDEALGRRRRVFAGAVGARLLWDLGGTLGAVALAFVGGVVVLVGFVLSGERCPASGDWVLLGIFLVLGLLCGVFWWLIRRGGRRD